MAGMVLRRQRRLGEEDKAINGGGEVAGVGATDLVGG